jgi:hypothetical protein
MIALALDIYNTVHGQLELSMLNQFPRLMEIMGGELYCCHTAFG